MSTVSKSQLLEYLEHAIALEGDLWGQNSIIDQFNEQCERNKPVYKPKSAPVESPDYIVPERIPVTQSTVCLYYFIGGMFIFFFLLVLFAGASPSNVADDKDKEVLWGIVGIIFGIAICVIGRQKDNKQDSAINAVIEANRKKHELHKEQCKKIDDDNLIIRAAYSDKTKDWQLSKDSGIKLLTGRKEDTETALGKYYSANIIFPKYRNLPALTSIYEYLTSGRCEELTGPNGAYNLYEMELRQNIVISQLNTIISNLEQIRQNQYVLYQELVKVTAATQSISREISAIRGYTYTLTELSALNTYYNAITADCTSALAFLEVVG